MQIKNNNQNFTTGFHILRVGIAVTFLWIGVLIFKNPEGWIGYMQPWAMNLLPLLATEALISTAILDILIGIFLLIDWYTWIAALLGTLHLVIVLTVSGISDITVRDIGLLAATIAITIESLPLYIKNKFAGAK